jgi:hypothetical protein
MVDIDGALAYNEHVGRVRGAPPPPLGRSSRGRLLHMKEDVLEQVVEDYLQLKGYFTVHNIPFKPDKAHAEYVSRTDSVASDIDVVGYCPRVSGARKVI